MDMAYENMHFIDLVVLFHFSVQKGPGYHLDLLIVGCLIFLHSALGLPWVVGATVVSISHVQSLYLYSPCTAPGERPNFLGVRSVMIIN